MKIKNYMNNAYVLFPYKLFWSGFMTVVGRIKELIVTAGGEKVSPALIEQELQEVLPALSQCLVVGEKRKFIGLLVALKTNQKTESEQIYSNDLLTVDCTRIGTQIGSRATTYSEAVNDPKWNQYVEKGVETVNASSLGLTQPIRRWAWLPRELREAEGELNAQGKLCRVHVLEKYVDEIDRLYGDAIDTSSGSGISGGAI